MQHFTLTPEQRQQVLSGSRVIEPTPEQDAYIKKAQEEEDAAFAADAGWSDAARLAAVRRRLSQLEETVSQLVAEIAELKGAK